MMSKIGIKCVTNNVFSMNWHPIWLAGSPEVALWHTSIFGGNKVPDGY